MMFATIGENCGWKWTYLGFGSIYCRYYDDFAHFAENHGNQAIFVSVVQCELVGGIEIWKLAGASGLLLWTKQLLKIRQKSFRIDEKLPQ